MRIWSEKVSAKKLDINVSTLVDNGSKKNVNVTVLAKVTYQKK